MPGYWYDHVHLVSSDPVKTAEFYEKMFDARRISVSELGGGRVMVELDLNGSRVLLMSRRVPAETAPGSAETGDGLEHFGIRTDNLETAVADLKVKGVQFKEEIRETGSGLKISFLWAPENVLVELLEKSS